MRAKAAAGVVLRVGTYALLALAGMVLLAQLLSAFSGYLITGAVSVFLTAVIANALAMRIFEKRNLAEIGLVWNPASVRNLLIGLVGGTGAACLVLVLPLLLRFASLDPLPDAGAPWRAFLLVAVVLVFGAAGEEILFRGYGFQVLLDKLGPFATILPVAVLFALAHSSNLNVAPLGLFNTMLWGVLLGAAFLRSGDLWLPIGLHLGWNWALPLFGANLSGFTIRVTGYVMRWKIGPVWSGGDYGPEGGLICTAILLALGVFLWKAPVRRQPSVLVHDLLED